MATQNEGAVGHDPETMIEILKLFGDIPADEMDLIKERLEKRILKKQVDSYHQMLLDRIFPRRDRSGKVIVPEPQPYREYMLMAGRHYRSDVSDMAEARKEHTARLNAVKAMHLKACKEAEANHLPEPEAPPMPEFRDPQLREFIPGNRVTPQNDGEALEMLQDPLKWRPVGLGAPDDEMARLVAEANAARATSQQKDEEIAKLKAAHDAQIEALKAQLLAQAGTEQGSNKNQQGQGRRNGQ